MKLIDKKAINRFKKNRGALAGLSIIIALCIIALFAPLIASYDPAKIFDNSYLLTPMWTSSGLSEFILGTDDVGRDIFSRLIYGARVSLFVGFFVVIFSSGIGVTLGLISGYFGGAIDKLIMRMVDIVMALPSILLAIVVVAILGPGLTNAVIAVGVVAVPSFVRIVRASVLNEKSKDYTQAGKSLGASHFRILIINILPNCLAPIIVQATLNFSEGILSTAALGFLGLGAQAPTPEWGTMLADARSFIESSPWLVTLPGLCIFISVLGFNLMGDGLRDAFDPKQSK